MIIDTWWSDNSIELAEIDEKIYALYGWNGEKYLCCWKCIDRYEAIDDGIEYEIEPIYSCDGEIIRYEVI